MRTRGGGHRIAAGILIAPSLFGIVLFLLVPLGIVLWLTTQRWNLIDPPRFVGTGNVVAVFTDPTFGTSVSATLLLTVLVVPLQTVLGLMLAGLLSQSRRGASVFRTLTLLPWIAAPLAVGVVWRWIFAPDDGLISQLAGRRVEWLVDDVGAPLVVALVLIWSGAGYAALLFTAGLRSVPRECVEAARLDGGATTRCCGTSCCRCCGRPRSSSSSPPRRRFSPSFDQVFALTGGGPAGRTDVLALRLYTEAFVTFDLGKAAVVAVFLLALLVALVVLQRRLLDSREIDATR